MPLLFSYGTLQQENVQLSTLGRRLNGQRDELPGFEQSSVRIEDPQIVAASGKTHHANVKFNGNESSCVSGMVFEITDAELARVDEYEVAFNYERLSAPLASGRQAWVYVHGHRRKDRPAIIAPPPLLTVVCFAAGFIAAHFKPIPIFHGAPWVRITLSVALVLLVAFIIFSGRQELVKHHEHPNPYRPTETIVDSGIYRFTRNPLYIGMLLFVLAVGIGANEAWLFVSLVALFLLLHFGVVKAEEKYLSEKFGSRYEQYRSSVRRWI